MSTFKTDPRTDPNMIEDAIYALTLASALEIKRREDAGLPATMPPEEGQPQIVSIINDPVNYLCTIGVGALASQLRTIVGDEAEVQDLVLRIAARIRDETGHVVPVSALFH